MHNTIKKVIAIVSLVLATNVAPALADPKAFPLPEGFTGKKGKYEADFQTLTYKGCLRSGGCIVLGRKYYQPCDRSNFDIICPVIRWKKGEYTYALSADTIVVYKNNKQIFVDSEPDR